MKELPIACTLTPDAMTERIDWLGRLGLIGGERSGRRLELSFAASARADVEAWMRAERECCAFLSFDLRQTDPELLLTVAGPAGAEPVLDGLLAALRAGP
jgi:hypothetical protein